MNAIVMSGLMMVALAPNVTQSVIVQAIVMASKKKSKKNKASAHKQSYHDALNILCGYLDLAAGEPFPSYLPKKLKELSYYDDDVLLETVLQNKENIEWALKSKTFSSTINKISYIMAIISNHISDVNKEWKRAQEIRAKQRTAETAPANYDEIIGTPAVALPQNSTQNKTQSDVSDLLGGDDLWT